MHTHPLTWALSAALSQHTPVPPLSPLQISTFRKANHISSAIHSSLR